MGEKDLLDNGYRIYTGEKLDVFFKAEQCAHSGVCVNGLKEVFDLKRKPWILVDNAEANEVKALIDKCPSGALQYVEK